MRHTHHWKKHPFGPTAPFGFGIKIAIAILTIGAIGSTTPVLAGSNTQTPQDQEWDTLRDDAAKDQIELLSSANKALFVSDTLANITEPTTLHYTFTKKSTHEKDFSGNVTLNVRKVDAATGRKDLTFRYLKGRNRVRFAPQIGVKSNPIFILFLERDAREMQRITGGNALFFRSRIRHSIARTQATDVEFSFDGNMVQGQKIDIKPFDGKELSHRFPRYREKIYTFLLSPQVPGGIYQIQARTDHPESGHFIAEETLTYQRMGRSPAKPRNRS